jgi:hypothetical protein
MQYLHSVYYELTASTCFEHHLLIFRRRYTSNNWYTACVLCLLVATRIGEELVSPIPVPLQLLFVQRFLKMSKWCSKRVEAVNS